MEISRVLIIGGGMVGSAAGQALLKKGISITATTRSKQKFSLLKEKGFTPLLCDIQTAQGFAHFNKPDVILLCPAPSEHHDHAYDQLYNKGIEKLLHYLHFEPPKKGLIYTSSVGVYDETEGNWVDETTPLAPNTPRQKALLQAEHHVQKVPFLNHVLRLGGIYGPDRNRIQAVKENKIPFENHGNFVNLIHIEDVVGVIQFLMQQSDKNLILNGVDGHPVVRGELFKFIAAELNCSLDTHLNSTPSSQRQQNKRCSNKKLLSLGYRFQFPSYQEGYRHLIDLGNKRRAPSR